MSDDLDNLLDDLDPSGSGQSDGGKLRKQLEAVLAQNKALQEQLATVKVSERNRALDALFEKHQIPSLARDFFPNDTDPTDEAATAFAEKYGQLWGVNSATAVTPPAQQQATQAIQQFVAQTMTQPTQELDVEHYAALLQEANTREELLSKLSELGAAVMG